MQIVTLDKNPIPNAAQPITVPAADESLPEIYHSVDDLHEARLALRKAARTIAAQDKRIRQLENLVLSDELTGLINRRGLFYAMQREIAAARRDGHANGMLILIDLDGFKSINDRWGHNAGDEYLRATAQALTGAVRASDVVARLGGDEFAVLLTRINEKDAIARVAELEKSFNGRMVEWNRPPVPLRASFGFAVYRGADTPEMVTATADLMLYAHKASRREQPHTQS
jgi:diguanylate cyclase (GGDEF)-like protein